jgi:hypothetical protein
MQCTESFSLHQAHIFLDAGTGRKAIFDISPRRNFAALRNDASVPSHGFFTRQVQ